MEILSLNSTDDLSSPLSTSTSKSTAQNRSTRPHTPRDAPRPVSLSLASETIPLAVDEQKKARPTSMTIDTSTTSTTAVDLSGRSSPSAPSPRGSGSPVGGGHSRNNSIRRKPVPPLLALPPPSTTMPLSMSMPMPMSSELPSSHPFASPSLPLPAGGAVVAGAGKKGRGGWALDREEGSRSPSHTPGIRDERDIFFKPPGPAPPPPPRRVKKQSTTVAAAAAPLPSRESTPEPELHEVKRVGAGWLSLPPTASGRREVSPSISATATASQAANRGWNNRPLPPTPPPELEPEPTTDDLSQPTAHGRPPIPSRHASRAPLGATDAEVAAGIYDSNDLPVATDTSADSTSKSKSKSKSTSTKEKTRPKNERAVSVLPLGEPPADEEFSVSRPPSQRRIWEAGTLFLKDENGELVPFQSLFPVAGDRYHGRRDHKGRLPREWEDRAIQDAKLGPAAPGSNSGNAAAAGPAGPPPPRTVVFFIRHFWCGQCQDYTFASLGLLDAEEVARQNVRVVVVSNGSWKIIKAYRKLFDCPFPILVDGPRKLYQLMGMTKMTNDFGPLFSGRAAYHQSGVPKQLLRGGFNALFKFPMASPGKLTQLGGEFIFGERQTCEFAHRMTNTSNHMEAPDVLRHAGVARPTKADTAEVRLAEDQKVEVERLEAEMVEWRKGRNAALADIRQRKAARRGEMYDPALHPSTMALGLDEELAQNGENDDLLAYGEADVDDDGVEMMDPPEPAQSTQTAQSSHGRRASVDERLKRLVVVDAEGKSVDGHDGSENKLDVSVE